MRGFVLITGVVALAGCSSEQRRNDSGATNINAAAVAAQGDIDTYAANTMQAAAPTPEPKTAPVAPPVEKLAARSEPAPKPAPATAGNSQAAITPIGSEVVSCNGQTRVSVRADDAEFARPDRDAPANQRAATGAWQPAAGPAVETDRDAGDQPTPVRCAAR